MARAMKDSGIAWIGEIPEEWECQKCKTILSANDGGVWGNDPIGDENDKVVIRSTEQTVDGKWCIVEPAFRDLSQVDYVKTRIIKDDLLITKSSGSDLHIGKTTIADDYFTIHECYFSNFIQRIRCDGFMPKLLWYLFNSSIIREQCVYLQNSTSGIGNINAGIIRNLYIPIPSVSEQRRIVFQLDAECARIDAVIEQTRASIEDYKKLKQAVITQAVTKGIRPNRPMKDSDIPWIGKCPEEWLVRPLKAYMDILPGYAFSSNDFDTENGVPLLRGINVSPDSIRWNDTVYWNQPITEQLELYLLQNNDLVVGLDRPWISEGTRVAFITDKDLPCLLLQRVCRIRPTKNIDIRFIYHAIAGKAFEEALSTETTGVSVPHISTKQIQEFIVALPDMSEQAEICDYLDAQCNNIVSVKYSHVDTEP